MELREKYRPKTLDEIIGQDILVKQLKGFVKAGRLPHAILFTGPPGCGKTTAAKILAKLLFCVGQNLNEINSASFKGIDTVRDLQSTVGLQPMGGKAAVYILDEAHELSKPAQDALLKTLEDVVQKYPHAYFMLCTTDPGKIIAAIRSRCTELSVTFVSNADIQMLLMKVMKAEGIKLEQRVGQKIIERCEGSPRKALVLLDQVRGLPEAKDQLDAIESTEEEKKGIDVARAIFNRQTKWADIAKIIKDVGDDPETIRHIVLGYATTILLSGGPLKDRAFLVIQAFRDNFYDCKKAGLAAACYEVFGHKS